MSGNLTDKWTDGWIRSVQGSQTGINQFLTKAMEPSDFIHSTPSQRTPKQTCWSASLSSSWLLALAVFFPPRLPLDFLAMALIWVAAKEMAHLWFAKGLAGNIQRRQLVNVPKRKELLPLQQCQGNPSPSSSASSSSSCSACASWIWRMLSQVNWSNEGRISFKLGRTEAKMGSGCFLADVENKTERASRAEQAKSVSYISVKPLMRAATKDSTADPGYPKLSKEDVAHSTAAERTSPLHSKLINSLAIVKTRSASGIHQANSCNEGAKGFQSGSLSVKLEVLIPTLRPLTRAAGISSLSPSSSSLSSGISVKTTLEPTVCKRLGRMTGSQGPNSRPINWFTQPSRGEVAHSHQQDRCRSCSSNLAKCPRKPGRQAFKDSWIEADPLTARRTRLRASTARHWTLRDWEPSISNEQR